MCNNIYRNIYTPNLSDMSKIDYSIYNKNINIQFKYIKKLGYGSFGNLTLYKYNNQYIVIKYLNSLLKDNKIIKNTLFNEYNNGILLKHPNIRKTYNIDYYNNCIFFEYCDGMDLFDFLQENNININEKLLYFTQIINGIEYMHNMGIAHMDLKLENIMIDNNKNIKIIDLGHSTIFKKNLKINGLHGTKQYCSPEQFFNNNYNPEKVDIWNLGILLYELIFQVNPWDIANDSDLNYLEFFEYYQNNKLLPSLFNFNELYISNLSYIELKFILLHSLNPNPENRCNINYIKDRLNKIT